MLNLLGMNSYNPTRPCVYKKPDGGCIVADLFIYIDDLRPTASSEYER